MSDIIRRIQKKFRRVRHSKTKIMNGKGNARKLITPNKRPKGPTLWDRLLASGPRVKAMAVSGTALVLAGATIGSVLAIAMPNKSATLPIVSAPPTGQLRPSSEPASAAFTRASAIPEQPG